MKKLIKVLCLVLALMMAATAALAVESSQIVGTSVITPHDYGARGLTQLPITDEPITDEPITDEPVTPEPTTPPTPPTGTIALVGAGIAAIVAGAGVVLFRKKED